MPSEESGGSMLFFTKQAAESEISKTTSSSRYNFYSRFERKPIYLVTCILYY
jgi:hypothetical protein